MAEFLILCAAVFIIYTAATKGKSKRKYSNHHLHEQRRRDADILKSLSVEAKHKDRESERERKLEVHTARMMEVDNRNKEREEKILYLNKRVSEAESKNLAFEHARNEYNKILRDALLVDHIFDFSSLHDRELPPEYKLDPDLAVQLKKPSPYDFIDNSISLKLSKFFPGHQQRVDESDRDVILLFSNSLSIWEKKESERLEKVAEYDSVYDQAVKDHRENRIARDVEISKFEKNYYAGKSKAIERYVSLVFEHSKYPTWFSKIFSVEYTAESKQLVLHFELPKIDIIPSTFDFKYIKSTDKISGKRRKKIDIDDDYSELISAITLRCLHEIFSSDIGGHINVCCFNGYMRGVDLTNGNSVRPCLISTRTTKEKFREIDLRHIDVCLCLKNLGAHVSRSASELQPIKPIVEFNMVDHRFVMQGDISSKLSNVQNLMDLNPYEFEELIANLFGKMGLESKLTRSTRDGGVDCIAYDLRPILGGKVVIQAKRYRHTVGVSAVRDLFGTMMNEGANKGILVTTSGYGPDAFNFAKDKPIELIDGSGLLHYLQEVGVNAKIIMPVD